MMFYNDSVNTIFGKKITNIIFGNNSTNTIFGNDSVEIRGIIVQGLGAVFSGFILAIAIFWGLVGGGIRNVNRSVYEVSYILVLLFFYICLTVYCILTLLPSI